MAGEWIPIDCNLADKPEVLELIDETGEPIEVVVYRLLRLWSWAALNTADGTLRATPARLKHVAGGDEDFWLAVERVGWVQFNDGSITISGWDKRFSQAAKARAQANKRQDSYRKRKSDATPSRGCDAAPSQGRDATESPQERTREDKREEIKKPSVSSQTKPQAVSSAKPKEISWDSEAGWQNITEADRQEWLTAYPGADLKAELAKSGSWLKANPKRAGKRNWRRFLVNWLSRCHEQGGSVRKPGNRPDDKPPPERWIDQYQPAEYRRPKEAVALAATLKIREEG